MKVFDTKRLPVERDEIAPDGSDVRILLQLEAGGMAHYRLPPGETSIPVAHKTVQEIWYFVAGRGAMWRWQNGREEVVDLEPGVCITIPTGTHFQFRSLGKGALEFIAVTMPPWPGEGEDYKVQGYGEWEATVRPQFPR